MTDPLLWSIDEAARILGDVSIRTVQRLIERREFPVIKVGRRVMIPARAILEWVDQKTAATHNHHRAGPGVRKKEVNACHTDAKIVPYGGCHIPTQVARELDALLKRRTAGKREPLRRNGS